MRLWQFTRIARDACCILFISHHTKCLWPLDHVSKASLSQTFQGTTCYGTTGFAVEVANIMKQASIALEHSVEFAVEHAGVKFARETKDGRIMDNPIKAVIFKRRHHLVCITHHLLNLWILKQTTRPGVLPCDLLRPRIKLYGNHLHCRFRGLNSRIAQTRCRIEHTTCERSNGGNLFECVLH